MNVVNNFVLNSEDHADIIAFLSGIQHGKRSATIRYALLKHMKAVSAMTETDAAIKRASIAAGGE